MDFEIEEKEEDLESEKEEKEANEEEIGDEDGTSREVGEAGDENATSSRDIGEAGEAESSREETRIERGNDAPPTLLERGSLSVTTCK